MMSLKTASGKFFHLAMIILELDGFILKWKLKELKDVRMSKKIRSDIRKFFQEVENLIDDLRSFETFWDSLFFKKVKLLKQGC